MVAGAQQQRVGREAGVAQGRKQQQVHVGGRAAVGVVGFAQGVGGKVAVGAVVAHGGQHQAAHGGGPGRQAGVLRRQGLGRLLQKTRVAEAAAKVVGIQQPGVDFLPGAGQVVVGLVGPLLTGQLKVEAGGVVGQRGHVGLGREGGQVLQHPAVLLGGGREVEHARHEPGRHPAAFAHRAVQGHRAGAHAGLLHVEGPAGMGNDGVLVKARNADPVLAPAHRNGALKRPVLEIEQVIRREGVGKFHHRALAHVGHRELPHVHGGRALLQKHATGFEHRFLHPAVHEVVGSAAQAGYLLRVLVAVVQRDFHRGFLEARFFQDFKARNPLKHHLKAAAVALQPRAAEVAQHHSRGGAVGHERCRRQVLAINLPKLNGVGRKICGLGAGRRTEQQGGNSRQQRHALPRAQKHKRMG